MDRDVIRTLTEEAVRSTLGSYRLVNGEKRKREEVTALGPGVRLETEATRSRDGTYTVSVAVKETRGTGDDREVYIQVVRPTIASLVMEYLDNGIDWRNSFVVFELEQEDVLDLCGYKEVTGSFTIEDVTLAVPETADSDDLSDLMLGDSGIEQRNEDVTFDPR